MSMTADEWMAVIALAGLPRARFVYARGRMSMTWFDSMPWRFRELASERMSLIWHQKTQQWGEADGLELQYRRAWACALAYADEREPQEYRYHEPQ